MTKPIYIILSLSLLLLVAVSTFGQGIKVVGGAHLKASGGVSINVVGSNGGVTTTTTSKVTLDNSSRLLLTGNLVLGPGSTTLGGTILFSGNRAQTISSTTSVSLANLTINKNGNSLSLQTPVLVNRVLNLDQGIINTSSTNRLILGPRKSFNTGSSNSYINGVLAIQTAAEAGTNHEFTFPVGDDSDYGPVTMGFTQDNATSTTYSVELSTDNVPDYDLPGDLAEVSGERFWKISNSNQNNFSNATITLPITDEDGINVEEAVIAKATSTQWSNIGGKDISIPGTITSTEAFTTWGDFAIGEKQLIPTLSAEAGANQTFTADESGLFEVPLDGSASTGEITSYVWRKGDTDIANGETAQVSLPVGTHIITLIVSDGTSTDTDIVTFVVNPKPDDGNTQPILEVNAGAEVVEGNSVIISRNLLLHTDKESGADKITYKITQAPVHGSLRLQETDLVVDDTFTQQNINEGNVEYVQQTSDVDNDSFSFSVSDEQNSTLAPSDFRIIITKSPQPLEASTSFTNNHLVSGNSVTSLDLSVELTGDRSSLSSARFRYAGLSEEQFGEWQEVTEVDGKFTNSFTAVDLLDVDPIGIRYQYEFVDAGGNPLVGAENTTYWIYDDTFFSSDNNAVGPWHAIGEKTENFVLSDFNLVAFPFEPQQVDQVIEELLPYDTDEWRLFRFEKSQDSFVEYNQSGFSTNDDFDPLQGYFLIARNRTSTRLGGQIANMAARDPQNPDRPVHEVKLTQGWNLIGNPYPFTLDWEAVVRFNSVENSSLSQLELLRSGEGENDYAQSSSQLNAFEGAFVFLDDAELDLLVPPLRPTGSNGRIEENSSKDGWNLPISLQWNNSISTRNGVGMHIEATEGIDGFDALNVPKPQNQAELIIQNDEYPMNRSVVPEQPSYHWHATIEGGQDGDKVTLSWDKNIVQQLLEELYLWDEASSRLISMASQSEYSSVVSGNKGLPFQIYYGNKNDFWQILDVEQVVIGHPFPNPAESVVAIPVTIPTNYQERIVVAIYDSQGRMLSQVEQTNLRRGYQELEISLPEQGNGLYHYRIETERDVYSGQLIKR
ncbi:MAG: cadherin-like domain-containing protein [Cyclobacteriaceae bacterium]